MFTDVGFLAVTKRRIGKPNQRLGEQIAISLRSGETARASIGHGVRSLLNRLNNADWTPPIGYSLWIAMSVEIQGEDHCARSEMDPLRAPITYESAMEDENAPLRLEPLFCGGLDPEIDRCSGKNFFLSIEAYFLTANTQP